MKPTLLVLAGGMGSRYGGVKQIDAVGLHNETLLDYAVYDAVHNGFEKWYLLLEKILKPISAPVYLIELPVIAMQNTCFNPLIH